MLIIFLNKMMAIPAKGRVCGRRRGAVTNNGCLVNQKMAWIEHEHCPQKWTSAIQRHQDCRRVDVDACRAMILRASLVLPLGWPRVDTTGRPRTGARRVLFQSRAVSKDQSGDRFEFALPTCPGVQKKCLENRTVGFKDQRFAINQRIARVNRIAVVCLRSPTNVVLHEIDMNRLFFRTKCEGGTVSDGREIKNSFIFRMLNV